MIAVACAACGASDDEARAPGPAAAAAAPAPSPPTASASAAPADPPPAPAASSEPLCPRAPCAERPIIFVHGYQGSNSDWDAILTGLVKDDPRFDAFRWAGTNDHGAWPEGIARRAWLFAFDYYVDKGVDPRGSYTAGPGRIGSGSAACASPAGAGGIVADTSAYGGVAHDYAADLASLVDDVLRATGAKKVDLVAHSMGGLVARSYLAFHGGNAKVERALLLSSPHLGVGLVGFAALFGLGPDWMAVHEQAELDSGSLLAKARFTRCGEPDAAKGAWPRKLLDVESTTTPIVPEVHVMSGSKDILVSYDSAHHPAAKTHVVVDADHAGILKAPETLARVEELMGGTHD